RLDAASQAPLPLGHKDRGPEHDPVRFVHQTSLAFPLHELASVDDGPIRPHLTVNFMGLLGPGAPLPLHLTQYVRDRERHHGDKTWLRFMDMFLHRMVS